MWSRSQWSVPLRYSSRSASATSTTLEERLRAAAGSTIAAPARDVAAATTRGLVPDRPDAEDSDDAAITTDKVLDENGIEEGILEKGTKRYWHPLDDEDSDGKAQHSIVIKGNKLQRERERRERDVRWNR